MLPSSFIVASLFILGVMVAGVNIGAVIYRAWLRGFAATLAAVFMAWSWAYASPFSRALVDTSNSFAAVSSGVRLKGR